MQVTGLQAPWLREEGGQRKDGLRASFRLGPAGTCSQVSQLPALIPRWTLSPLTSPKPWSNSGFLVPLFPVPTHRSSYSPCLHFQQIQSSFGIFAQLFPSPGKAFLSGSLLSWLLVIEDLSEPQKDLLQKQPVCQKDPRGGPQQFSPSVTTFV